MLYQSYIQNKIDSGAKSLSLSKFLKDNIRALRRIDFEPNETVNDIKRRLLREFSAAIQGTTIKGNVNKEMVDWEKIANDIKQHAAAERITSKRKELHSNLHEEESNSFGKLLQAVAKRNSVSAHCQKKKRGNELVSDGNGDHNDEPSCSSSHERNKERSSQSLLLEWIRDYNSLRSEIEKVESLIDHFGDGGSLDLTSTRFSSWNKLLIQNSIRSIKFPYVITILESKIIAYIHHCNNLDELKNLRQLLFSYQEVPDGVEYIRTAIHHIMMLWKSHKMQRVNQECWWRQFLYTPLFDNAFLFMHEFDIKRSECSSTVVEAFNKLVSSDVAKLPVHRTDFSLRNTDDNEDTISGEDKPGQTCSNEVGATLEKNKKLRTMACTVTKCRLPHPMLNHHFDTITTMWHGRQLIIHGTKEVNGKLLHYQAANCTVPLFPGRYCQIAKLLKVVLSLKRSILRTQAMRDALIKATYELFLESEDDGSRSPLDIDDKEDSFELDEETMLEMAALLSQTDEEQLNKYNEVLADLKSSDPSEPVASQEEIKAMLSTKPTLNDISSEF